MTKTEWLHKLYQEALQDLNDFEKFNDFLDFKSRLYKYDFVNSLLLWKQMPNASMVADLEIWGRFFRRVERGTKSIFILDKNTGNAKCVFDISQTYPTKEVSIHLWEFEGKEDIVRKNLVKEIDDNKKKSTQELIQSLAMAKTLHLVEKMKEKIAEFSLDKEEAIKLEMASMLVTAYAVDTILAKRVGYELKGMNVEEIKSFFPYLKDRAGLWSLIGNNISNLSKNILQGIERSIKEHEREKDIHRQGERDGIHRGGRRDVSSEHRAVRGARTLQHHRDGSQMEGVHSGKSSGEIHRTGTEATIKKKNVGSRGGSVGDDTEHRSEVSGSESVQSGRLHGHGNKEANGEELRQGSSGERVSVPLSLKDLEKVIILHGSGFTNGKYRIYEYFLNNINEKERSEFLKKEYGIGGYTYFTEQEDTWSVEHNATGMSFHKEQEKKTCSWKEIEKVIEGLIREHRYFTVTDQNNYPKYRQQQVLGRLERKKAYWDYENNQNELFLFGKKYEIGEIRENDILILKESDFPLNTLEIRKVDFEKEAIKNCQNDSKWITEEQLLLQNGSKEQAWVRVLFSENVAIPEQALFSFSVANSLFEKLDTEKHKEREKEDYEGTWYDKTKFCLTVKLDKENIVEITERQDFGDGNGSLYDFLKQTNVSPEILTILNRELIRDTQKEIELKEEIETIQNPATAEKSEEIIDEVLEEGGIGEKTKFRWNYEAIVLLNRLEAEDREPDFEERQTLKRFLGWGGLSAVFDEGKEAWKKEREELKALLTESEYEQAKASTPNSYYTPDFVIDEIHNYLAGYNIKRVLEPSAGTGRFLKSTDRIKYTAIELDSIPARIMENLYPKVNVMTGGYEEMIIKDSRYDAVIGNVPFGNYSLYDKRYEKEKFLIHEYFFAKSLDAVKNDGLLVLITGKGTMDKENSAVRKYISERAELLGAIRLPSSIFSKIAGTDVSADILILRKRNQKKGNENSWTGLGYTEEKVPINEYYLNHPEHMLGKMKFDHRFFGKSSKYTNCFLEESADIRSMLRKAFESIPVFEPEQKQEIIIENKAELKLETEMESFTYAVFDKKAYYRNSEGVQKQRIAENRAKPLAGMIDLRNHILLMLKEQKEDCSNERLAELQSALKQKYDSFVSEYGEISLQANQQLFEKDRYSAFVFSLEQQDKEGKRIYSALFSERILKSAKVITHTDSVEDAFLACLNEKGAVNIPYMKSLLGDSWKEKDIVKKLHGKIMYNPETTEYETAEEYLSGNVRAKLAYVEELLEKKPPEELQRVLRENKEALRKIQPIDLVASEIDVKLGTTWIAKEDYESFMHETLKTPNYRKYGVKSIGVEHNSYTGSYYVRNKYSNYGNILAYQTYGTERKNAYEIMEATLNLRQIKIYDTKKENGKEIKVLNVKETLLVKEKQNLLKEEFKEWIWKDETRRKKYETYYNENFNNLVLRKYRGDFLTFSGMNPGIALHEHQKEAIARCLMSGKNTLLAHAVGAGKTYEMIASCMEGKRLGLWQKPLFVVPNHLTKQTGLEFLHLYPSANILVAAEKDFQPQNRELFFAKMATGNFDAIIIGQTQLIKIGLSKEREIRLMKKEISEITTAIEIHKKNQSETWTTKNMEIFKKKLEAKLKALSGGVEKTKLLTFEDLKIDQMFIDEAHDFKSLPIQTKMNNVAGISHRESKRAMDLYFKIDYLREYYQNREGKERGVIFATATPISNSMAEMYVMQKYLQNQTLINRGIRFFDDWASTFGETTTSLELAPEGVGFRLRTRFGKFVNLPELLSTFQEVADIKTDQTLNLAKPQSVYHTIEVAPTAFTETKVLEYAERAEKIRDGIVDQRIDNMLKITHEGRRLGTDPRLLYKEELEALGEEQVGTKLDKVSENIYRIYKETETERLTQIVFSDIGAPDDKEKKFTVYDYVKKELIQKGVTEEEICFIHDAQNNKEKQEIFNKMKTGKIRIIIGSTQKMGTGVNIQSKAIALHHIDCPWRSSDIEQREGRILRPGNLNQEVQLYRYVTTNTFDGYLWQIVEQKQRFIDQVMNNRLVSRTAEDIDDRALTYAEVKAIATGNPIIIEKVELDLQIAKLETLKAHFQKQKNQQEILLEELPRKIAGVQEYLDKLYADSKLARGEDEPFLIEIEKDIFDDRGKAYKKLEEMFQQFLKEDRFKMGLEAKEIGKYFGFSILIERGEFGRIGLLANASGNYSVYSESLLGGLTKLVNKLSKSQFEKEIQEAITHHEDLIQNKEELTLQKNKPFPQEEELKNAKLRAKEIDGILNVENDCYDVDQIEEVAVHEMQDEMER